MKRSHQIGLGVALGAAILFAVSPPTLGATRTFDFDTGAYGVPDMFCGNKPVPPLFNYPEFGSYTGMYIWGEPLPRGATTGCGNGVLNGNQGSDSYLTYGYGYTPSNLLRFSWDYEKMNSTWSLAVTGANWTNSGRRLTLTGAFVDYQFAYRDTINITAGTGVTPGDYIVTSKVNDDTITLGSVIAGGANVIDNTVAGTIRRDMNALWANVATCLYSYTTPLFPNPTVDIGVGSTIEMKITSQVWVYNADPYIDDTITTGDLEFSLLIQETGRNLPLGEDGGQSGTIELVGADSRLGYSRTPVGGISIPARPTEDFLFTTLKWTFVDRNSDSAVDGVDVTVTPPGGPATTYNKSIVPFSDNADGVLAAATNRATLASLAIRRSLSEGETTPKKWFVWIDDIIIDAPGIADPVKVTQPIRDGDNRVTITYIDPLATKVKLHKDVGVDVSGANWTESGLALTKTGAFAGYTWASGDKIAITAGTGVTTGTYAIASKDSADQITLATSITGGADVTDNTVAGRVTALRLFASADAPPEDFSDRTHDFTGLTAFTLGEVITATQVVDGVESAPCAEVTVSEAGTVEDFTTPPVPLDDAAGCQDRTWHAASNIAWSYVDINSMDGSACLRTWDSGWTNGIYAIFPNAFVSSGQYHVEAKVHVHEADGGTGNPGRTAISQYQVGARAGGTCIAGGVLPPMTNYGSYKGLTTGNDDALPPQIVSTKEFPCVQGQNVLVALSTDVVSGSWNGGSVTWYNVPDGNCIRVDNIKVIEGPPPITDCNSVPKAEVGGPLLFGATSVEVNNVGAAADYVTVYVNGVKKGELDTRTLPDGTMTVPLNIGGTYTLKIGDLVEATQTYPNSVGTEIEGCNKTQGIVGGGSNPGDIYLTLALRETKVSTAMGADQGVTGSIEWIGAQSGSSTSTGPIGKLISPSTAWQTVTFTMPTYSGTTQTAGDPVMSYEAGNGILEGGYPRRCAFEHLAITPTQTGTGPYVIWFDNVTAGGVVFGNGFEDCLPALDPPLPWGVGTGQVMFRSPRYLTSFAPYILSSPCESFLDDTQADGGTGKSVKVRFQFTQERRWVRLTTYSLYGSPSPYYPNPAVNTNGGQTVSVRVLYPPATMLGEPGCATPPTVAAISPVSGPQGVTLTGVQITGTNFLAGQTQVKLYRAASATTILGTNVNVTSPTTLTCDFDLTAPPAAGTYDVMVGTCQYATKAGAFTVCALPTATAISPTSGANFTSVNVTITGTNFSTAGDGASVKLTRAGCADIVATNVVVVSATSITATLALPGDPASIGLWALVVNTCGGTATRADSFTVNCTRPSVNAPLKAGDTSVVLTNCVTAPEAITVYANGSSIGTKTSGFAGTGTETVTVSALVKDAAIHATQTVGGVESCVPADVVVGSGINSGVMLTLGIRENANLTGPVGADGVNITASGGSDATYIMDWLVLDKGASAAPFTAVDRATAYSTDWLAADGGEASIAPTSGEYTSGGKQWMVHNGTAGTDHRIWFEGDNAAPANRVYAADGVSPDLTMCAAYAVTYVRNYGPNIAVRIKWGSDDGMRVYVNGSSRVNSDANRGYVEDQNTSGSFTLYSGWNTIVVKVSENAGGWAFGLRLVTNVADETGAYVTPVPNLEVSATRPTVLARSNMVEWFGASTTSTGGAPQGKLIAPSADWQTVTFTPGVDPVCNYSAGNGVLNGTYGVLDNVAITSVGSNTGPYVLYIDNVTSESTTFEDFESYTVPADVMFRPPRALSSANLLPGLDIATLDDTKGDASTKSERVEFQFVDLSLDRWVRLQTGLTLPANRPNPQVRLDQPITLRVLLVGTACTAPTVTGISPSTGVQNHTNVRPHPPYDGVQVPSYTPVHATITGTGFVAGATVKLAQSGKSDIVATNVVVVSDTQITCDIDLGGAAPGALDGAWDVVVTTCAAGTLPGGFSVAMCFTPAQDTDGDGDVDLADFGTFQGCFNGPNRAYKPQAAPPMGDIRKCACLDVGDNPVVADVDLSDFNKFQGCFNGPNRPQKAGC